MPRGPPREGPSATLLGLETQRKKGRIPLTSCTAAACRHGRRSGRELERPLARQPKVTRESVMMRTLLFQCAGARESRRRMATAARHSRTFWCSSFSHSFMVMRCQRDCFLQEGPTSGGGPPFGLDGRGGKIREPSPGKAGSGTKSVNKSA
eukprot:5390715-Pyramimonas_sp.AAC.3